MAKQITVFLYNDSDHQALLKQSAKLSQLQDATLNGVFVTPDFMEYSALPGAYPVVVTQDFREIQKSLADQAKISFDKETQSYDIKTTWSAHSETEVFKDIALYSDYLFVSQPSKGNTALIDTFNFVDTLILSTGMPTFVIPENYHGDIGRYIALGWKETREAATAIRKTMPLLQAAKKVTAITAASELESAQLSGEKIIRYLQSHGVTSDFKAVPIKKSGKHDTELIIDTASADCDCIVIGAYGHSRFKEMILGGVTRELIRDSTIPILLAH